MVDASWLIMIGSLLVGFLFFCVVVAVCVGATFMVVF